MNKNINLTKILKDCPIGWEFYSSIYGNITFLRIDEKSDCPIVLFFIDKNKVDRCVSVTEQGLDSPFYSGECTLFPSKEQRDWSNFTAPWYKKERDTIAWLEEPGKKEYGLKSFKDEDVCKFMQYIEKQAKAYEFNLPNRDYDIYAFAKDLLVWFEKQEFYYTFEIKEGHWYKCVCDYMLNGSDLMFKNDNLYYCRSNWRLRGEIDERNVKDIGINGYKSFFRPATNQEIKDWLEKKGEQEEPQVYETEDGEIITYSETDGYKFVEPNFHENERAWLYLVSDVLTWKDGIGQYIDDPRVQELAKRLCIEYSQKLYNPSVLSNSSNTGKNEKKSADKIEPRFKVGDWITIKQ